MNGLTRLRSTIDGTLLLDGDDGFDSARQSWNTTVDQLVLAVVDAAHENDIATTVRFAADNDMVVATQPSGHGATGSADGTILLRTSRFDRVDIDAAARIARVGAGVSWGQVLASAQPHGLTGLPGSSGAVTVAGYALSGGISWFARMHGWASDHVAAFEVVTADGVLTRVTDQSDPELFWALRGAGGDFAVVTGMDVRLYPLPGLLGGQMVWPYERRYAVVDAFRQVTRDAPPELTVWLNITNSPQGAPSVSVFLTYVGAPGDARDLLAPFARVPGPCVINVAPLPISRIGEIAAEPTDPTPALFWGEWLDNVDDTTIEFLFDTATPPLINAQIRHLGGALAAPTDNPHGAVEAPFLLNLFGIAPNVAAQQELIAKQRSIADGLGPAVRTLKPHNFLSKSLTIESVFDPPALARLRHIKKRRDPQNVYRSNFPL